MARKSASNRSEAAPVKTNSSSVLIIPIYTAAIFLSAALLFAVQPMFTKMVLPRFGGSPSVWSVAMVFFQGILLLGYAYADILTRFVRGPLALLIHLAVMLGGAVFLPVAIAKGWGLPPSDREQLFLLGLFSVSIGFPFFALSANGPLLQAWFARSGLAQAENPYFLYAASNIGSLLALFAYPFAAEPFSTLSFQGSIWRFGYYLLIALPLSLYLISFILVFSQRRFVREASWIKLQPFLLALLVLTLALEIRTWLTIDVALHLLTFFVTAMICHGLMAATRPQAAYLTRFYFCMSLGGVLGGIFSGLIAPRVFSWIAEYPLLVVAAALARPGLGWPKQKEARLVVMLVALVVIVALPGLHQGFSVIPPYNWIVWGAVVALVACAVSVRNFPLRLAVLFAAVFVVTRTYPPNARNLETARSFFGVHKIEVTPDGRFRVLRHGMELHGAQRLTTDDGMPVTGRPELSTYYHPDSPIAEAIDAVQDKKKGPIDAAVIGLGAGSIACLMKPDDHLDYYEIDAEVIRIARDPQRFTLLRDCKPDAKIVLGDARLTIADATDARYDVIVVDAFSSDSIPVHLLTREALRIYLSRLNPGGIIITHISNHHLDLREVVTATAASEKLIARLYDEDEVSGGDPMIKFSTVLILARNDDDFGLLRDWELQTPAAGEHSWSDDFSNLLGPLIAKFREGD